MKKRNDSRSNKAYAIALLILWILAIIFVIYASTSKASTNDPNEVMLPGAIHTMWYRDVVISVNVTDANEIAPHKWDLKGDVKIMPYPEALGYMSSKWTAPFNLNDFVFLSKSWPGHPEPNEPPVPVLDMHDPNSLITPIPSDPNDSPVYYRIAGCKTCRIHMFLACSAIYGKEWELTPFVPNNVCLKCLARKEKEL